MTIRPTGVASRKCKGHVAFKIKDKRPRETAKFSLDIIISRQVKSGIIKVLTNIEISKKKRLSFILKCLPLKAYPKILCRE